MKYQRIDRPKWLEKEMEKEGLFDDVEYNRRNIQLYFVQKGKSFPLIQVNITYFIREIIPGLGNCVGFHSSVKYDKQSFWEKCHLPWDVMEAVFNLKDEILKIKPQIE